MIAPPRFAAWLLESTLSASERDAVMGDLYEEFTTCIAPTRSAAAARWWYRSQVWRSLAPLWLRAWERASAQRASAALVGGALLATVPASLLITIRTFVLQQVPLKTTPDLSVEFALTLGIVALCAGVVGFAAAIRVLNADSRQR
jgi:hypothetical protein